jgi:hypothetical protein
VARVLAADAAVRLAERGRRRREDHAPHAGAGRGADGGLGPAHVDVEQRRRIVRAHRVDAGDVVQQLATGHAAGEGVLVEHVAAHDARAELRQLALRGVGARERDRLVPALRQPAGERATDQPAPAGQEDAHVASPRVSAGSARTR